MKINGKMIESQSEILQLINEGVNPLEYMEGDYDIDLITKAIAHAESSEDPYFDDMAEILLKSIVHYLYANDSETKTLRRCKDILDEVMNSSDRRMAMTNVIGDNERDNGTVTYRKYGEKDQTTVSIDEFVNIILEHNKNLN